MSKIKHRLTLKNVLKFPDLIKALRLIEFRGIYDKQGDKLKPYARAKFIIAKIYPPKNIGQSPKILIGKKEKKDLFTPQPTIYQNQIQIMETVDLFLKENDKSLVNLKEAIEYEWHGRGIYHVLPPIIEKHTYDFNNGFIDLNKLALRFKHRLIKDAKGNLHDLSHRFLNKFHIDEVSTIDHLDIFNSNMPIINYGLKHSGKQSFYIVCDGSHRIDYAIEKLGVPITVIVVETEKESTPLIPYYALPVSFSPTLRLTSKESEKMYSRLERDKIHILNDFIKKTLHYDWEKGGLSVSKLRSNL